MVKPPRRFKHGSRIARLAPREIPGFRARLMSGMTSANNRTNFEIEALHADLSHQAAQENRRLGTLDGSAPHVLGHALV